MIRDFSPIIKRLLFFFSASFIVSVCKNECILSPLPEEYVWIARISSLTSTVVGNSASVMLLFIILYATWYLSVLIRCHINLDSFIESANNFIGVFIIGEAVKFSLIWIFLREEVLSFDYDSSDIMSQLTSTYYFKISNYTSIAIAVVSTIVFGYSVFDDKSNPKFASLITLVLAFLLFLNILL